MIRKYLHCLVLECGVIRVLYFGLMHFLCCFLCFAEHPEDKQLPVHPAAGHSSSVCHHPQLTPTGPGLLRHAHLLQPCWWVWSCSPLRLKKQPPRPWLFVLHAAGSCSFLSGTRCCNRNVSEFSLCVAAFVFTEFSLSSAEISSLQGFSSPGLSLGSMSAWQQHQLGQAALNSLVWVTHFQTKAHSPDALT